MIYWSITQIPELKGFEKQEANRIWREANKLAIRDPRYWLAFLPAGVLAGIGSMFGLLGGIVIGGLGGGICGLLAMAVIRPYAAQIVRQRQSTIEIGR